MPAIHARAGAVIVELDNGYSAEVQLSTLTAAERAQLAAIQAALVATARNLVRARLTNDAGAT